MPDLGKAYVQIVPSAKGIKGSIEKEIGGEVASAGESAGGGFASGIKSAILKAGIGVAVGKVVKDSLSEGAALQQSIGGIQTLFGNQGAKDVEEYAAMQKKSIAEVGAEFTRNQQAEAKMMENAAKAYQTAGLSRNEYMEQAASFSATLLQGLEGDTMKAAEYADKAMINMSDNANKFGTDISAIQNAYQGFAKDNYTMLDNLKLGYGGTQSEMARLINDSGVLDGEMEATAENVKDIPFDKVIEAIDVIQTRMGVAGTTSEEASKTFTGSMQAMQAASKNLLGAIATGDDISEPLYALTESVVTFVSNNLIPMLSQALTAIPEVIGRLLEQIAVDAEAFTPKLIDMIVGIVDSILQNMPYILSGIAELLITVADALLSYDWSTVLSDLINNFSESWTTLLPHIMILGFNLQKNLINGILEGLPQFLATVPTLISDFLNTITQYLPQVLESGIEILTSLIDGIVDNIDEVISTVIQLINIIIKTTIENLPTILKAGIEILLALISGIVQAIPELISECIMLGSSITETLMNIDWIGLGADILEGIAEGVIKGVSKLVEAVKGAGKKALDTAKKALGIHSPSAVFRDEVGKQIDAGIAGGIKKYTNPITSAMNSLSDMTQSRFNASAQIRRNSSQIGTSELALAGAGNITVPVYIGNTKMGQAVATANQMNKYRSGGR